MKRRAFLGGLMVGGALSFKTSSAMVQGGKALSGDRFIHEGEEFVIADIIAPPLYTFEDVAPAYFSQSRRALQAILSGGVFNITDVLEKTRWGVRRVHVTLEGGVSAAQMLVAEGAARVHPQTDDWILITNLLELETRARAARRGLWREDTYNILSATDASPGIGDYALVQGVVIRAANTSKRFYLNFGEDYKTDFTAGTTKRFYNRWVKDGFDLGTLEGSTIRVRGRIDAINGPSIDLVHRGQVEVLELPTT